MSLRFTGQTTQELKRTASPPSVTTFTEMAWFYITTDRNVVTIFLYKHNAGDTQWIAVDTGADGTTLRLDTVTGVVVGSALSVATWYHLALVKSGTSYTIYLNGVSDVTATDAQAVNLITDWCIGNVATFPNGLDGRVAAYKVWDGVALSPEEVRAEMWLQVPRRLANLYAWMPMVNGVVADNVVDHAGLAHPWTIAGTLTVEDGPPISWGAQRTRHQRKAPIPITSAPEIFLYEGVH